MCLFVLFHCLSGIKQATFNAAACVNRTSQTCCCKIIISLLRLYHTIFHSERITSLVSWGILLCFLNKVISSSNFFCNRVADEAGSPAAAAGLAVQSKDQECSWHKCHLTHWPLKRTDVKPAYIELFGSVNLCKDIIVGPIKLNDQWVLNISPMKPFKAPLYGQDIDFRLQIPELVLSTPWSL